MRDQIILSLSKVWKSMCKLALELTSLLLWIHKRLSHAPPCILKESYSNHTFPCHCAYNFFDVSNVSPLMQARCLPSSAHVSIMCLAAQSMDRQNFMLNYLGGNNSATTNALINHVDWPSIPQLEDWYYDAPLMASIGKIISPNIHPHMMWMK